MFGVVIIICVATALLGSKIQLLSRLSLVRSTAITTFQDPFSCLLYTVGAVAGLVAFVSSGVTAFTSAAAVSGCSAFSPICPGLI